MKRLPFDGKFCEIAICEDIPGSSTCENGLCSQREVWERLKAIEDILGNDYDLEELRQHMGYRSCIGRTVFGIRWKRKAGRKTHDSWASSLRFCYLEEYYISERICTKSDLRH